MFKNFRTYQSAVQFYRSTRSIAVSGALKEQLARAASSIVLNLAEGSGRSSKADQKRFFVIAMGSLRETQAIIDIAGDSNPQAVELANQLGLIYID